MSKDDKARRAFDYSKWDNIELSDDEDDVHPNIDRESWFRMKHRSRVEREDNESKDKANLLKEMDKAKERIKVLQHELTKLAKKKKELAVDEDDDDDDDELAEEHGINAEITELIQANAARQERLDEYERQKKWNVDNMFHVTEERTVVNPKAGELSFTETGHLPPADVSDVVIPGWERVMSSSTDTHPPTEVVDHANEKSDRHPPVDDHPSPVAQTAKPKKMEPTPDPVSLDFSNKISSSSSTQQTATTKVKSGANSTGSHGVGPSMASAGAMETYPQFVEKYSELLETYMAIPDLNGTRDFLLQHADVLLQENASNYLLLASLEDEMNEEFEKMKRTTRQSQILTNIAELSKSLKTHPGNVIMPFFARLEQREHLEEFLKGVKFFQDKIRSRAVVKKAEIDAERAQAAAAASGETDGAKVLQDLPVEDRLGPGGLDPLEVIETLPRSLVDAFESRDVEQLKRALLQLPPEEAEYHMKRCVDSGLWVAGG